MNNKIKLALLIIWIIAVAVIYTIVGYKLGYNAGFNACIEEANLYELYDN